MSRVIRYSVRVHACRLGTKLIPFSLIESGHRYVPEEAAVKPAEAFYRMLPDCCRCRKWITLFNADRRVQRGSAFRILRKKKRGALVAEEREIWVPIIHLSSKLPRVPRIDLITSTDIERAYVFEQQKFIDHIERVHKMYMEERAKLITEFRPDPFEGRALFIFPDERSRYGR